MANFKINPITCPLPLKSLPWNIPLPYTATVVHFRYSGGQTDRSANLTSLASGGLCAHHEQTLAQLAAQNAGGKYTLLQSNFTILPLHLLDVGTVCKNKLFEFSLFFLFFVKN